jgi:hypothetical protein
MLSPATVVVFRNQFGSHRSKEKLDRTRWREGLIEKLTGAHLINLARLHLFSQSDCINSAASLGDGKVFGVCMTQYDNFNVTSDLIIYDSSDQIMLPSNRRSAEWNRIASPKLPDGEFDFVAHSMGDHFYDVYGFERREPKPEM